MFLGPVEPMLVLLAHLPIADQCWLSTSQALVPRANYLYWSPVIDMFEGFTAHSFSKRIPRPSARPRRGVGKRFAI